VKKATEERLMDSENPQIIAKPPAKVKKQHRALQNIFTGIAISILLLVIGSMIASQFFNIPILDFPRRIIARVVTPIQEAFASGTDGIVGYLRRLKLRSNLEYEYDQLLGKVDDLTDKAMLVDELRNRLQKYEDLDDELVRNTDLQGIRAIVIGRDTTNYFSSFTIDVGSNQGIEESMAVVVPGALVGYTYNVTNTKSQVKAIIDSDASIAALIESTRDQGSISGTLGIDGTPMCRMYYLPDEHLPRPGDLVVTSGVGMEFPKGIPIGTVRESTRGMEDNKQFVIVEPIADFEHIEYVIVYRYRPSYAEQADTRSSQTTYEFQPLATARPVPTFGVSGSDLFATNTAATPAPSAAVSSTPTPAATPSPDPHATPVPSNFAYSQSHATPSPVPTPAPSITPKPTPTYSIDQVTVEDDI
jgi:rod shape-determining protein MreC